MSAVGDPFTISRGHLLMRLGAGVGAAAVSGLVDNPLWSIGRGEAATRALQDPIAQAPAIKELQRLAEFALDEATASGCSYADIQVVRQTGFGVVEIERFGCGMRVIHTRAWGLAASRSIERNAIARLTAKAVASAQRTSALPSAEKDRFGMPIDDWLAFWRTLDGMEATSTKRLRVADVFFASTEGRRTSYDLDARRREAA